MTMNSHVFEDAYADQQTKSGEASNHHWIPAIFDQISGIDLPILSEQDYEDVCMLNQFESYLRSLKRS